MFYVSLVTFSLSIQLILVRFIPQKDSGLELLHDTYSASNWTAAEGFYARVPRTTRMQIHGEHWT